MHRILSAFCFSLLVTTIYAQDATVLHDGYHFRMPVAFDRAGYILFDPSLLPKNILVHDPGLRKVAPYKPTRITLVRSDMSEPDLFYRGKSVEIFCEKGSFDSLSSFLIFEDEKAYHYEPQSLPEKFQKNMQAMIQSTYHPADFFSAFLQVLMLDKVEATEEEKASHLLNIMPTYAAWCCRLLAEEKDMSSPQADSPIATNFLQMYMGTAWEELSPVVQEALSATLDDVLILQADHGVNTSTAAVRNAASVGAGVVPSVCAGYEVLFGPRHSGSGERVIEMLQTIGQRQHVSSFVEDLKKTNDLEKLAGFGHPAYESVDPRAKLMKQRLIDLVTTLKDENYPISAEVEALLDTALALESVITKDVFFKEKKIFPNLSFYTAIFYQLIGIPSRASSVMCAFARLSGWIAHWFEQRADPKIIIRPRAVYAGEISASSP